MMVRTKIFVKEDMKMLYTEKEKHEIERVKEVFAEHLRQSPDFELLWSDKVGYVWLTIGVNPVYVDTGIRIESAADLCGKCLDDVATDVLYMTGNDHALEAADPLELAEIKRLWEPYINQLPDYAYLCKDFLYSLNLIFLFFCVQHFHVLLDKNFGAYHHQFSTRRLRLSVCHIC